MPRADSHPSILPDLPDRVMAADSVAAAITDIRAHFDLDHVTYHLVRNLSEGVDSPFVRTTYPMEWVGEYVIRQYVDRDPVIRAGLSRSAPFDWASLRDEPFYDEIMAAAEKFGIGRNGYSVPVADKHRRHALVSFNSSRGVDEWSHHLLLHVNDFIELAHLLHRKAVAEVYGQNYGLPQLGPRELECLTWTARGKESKEIAAILKLSDHTVRTYLRSARFKLACATLSQAVGQALRYQLITL